MADLSKESLVSAPSRLHLGLIDCGNTTMRLFGGSGIALEGPRTVVAAKPASEWKVEYAPNNTPNSRGQQDVLRLIHEMKDRIDPVLLKVFHSAPEHKGLGSKTSLLLSIATASLAVYQSETNIDEITKLTKRGGTSGIGINSFWVGGFITDNGHPNLQEREFAPSSARNPEKVPQVLARLNMPDMWHAHLFYDPKTPIIEGEMEKGIFTNSMPLDDLENLKALAATYHGVIPAIQDKDISALAMALQNLNSSGMKAIELNLQTDVTKAFLDKAWGQQKACGLSSFGPTIYGIEPKDTELDKSLELMARSFGLRKIGTYGFDNKGMSLQVT
jgi:beta-ribofuranosylaminobenzene 5'-phosphate synthase